jgi:hypothetical protein
LPATPGGLPGRGTGQWRAMTSDDTPETPEPGTDSKVEDWFGQSVDRDAELADELSEELPPPEAEREFEEQADGRAEQQARRGERIDPEQGESAYREER